MTRETIEKLAAETGNPCVTISLNTHRTKPDYIKDRIILKNLCRDAEKRVVSEYGKRPVASLLKKLATISDKIDFSLNLDSLHIFLSNKTTEIVKSSWPAHADRIMVSDHFALRPLIYAVAKTEEYMILLLSQSGVSLFYALNDKITGEVQNDSFPFGESPHYHTDRQKLSDPEAVDNMVREFLNKVDKAVVNVNNQTGLDCVVISTEDNFSRLMQVADKPYIYIGFAAINYNNVARHFITGQAWELVKKIHVGRTQEAIKEMKEAVAGGKAVTDLQEIYSSAKEGKGDLLITSYDYFRPVMIKAYDRIEPVDDASQAGVIDDVTSLVAWEVFSKKGRVFFAVGQDLAGLGDITLKLRY
jgi:hypothetical protein